MKEKTPAATAQRYRYRVRRGEPGRDVVTELRQGDPVIESPPLGLASPPPSSLPAVISEEIKPIILSHCDEIAHYRYDLIRFFLEAEASQKAKPRSEIIDQFLSSYNSGHLLPDLYKKLRHISRGTLYRWLKAFDEGDIQNLAPQTDRKGTSKITDDEINFLFSILYSQKPKKDHHIKKIGTAIRMMKYIFDQRRIPSPSSPRTLLRLVNQFEKEHYDLKVLRCEGEKALNDKVLPYLPRDRTLIEVGEGLVADGHRLNFDIINPFTGKPCRPVIVVFLDWRSSYLLGWEIMLEENVQCIASAQEKVY